MNSTAIAFEYSGGLPDQSFDLLADLLLDNSSDIRPGDTLLCHGCRMKFMSGSISVRISCDFSPCYRVTRKATNSKTTTGNSYRLNVCLLRLCGIYARTPRRNPIDRVFRNSSRSHDLELVPIIWPRGTRRVEIISVRVVRSGGSSRELHFTALL